MQRRLSSRFLRPEDSQAVQSLRNTLRAAGLAPVTDIALVQRISAVRNQVSAIRETDELFNTNMTERDSH